MRVITAAAILLMSSSLVPSFAQDEKAPTPSQPQTIPVQPERTPQQSDQSREQDRQRAEDTRVDRGWRAERRDGDNRGRMGQNDMERMRREMDEDRQTVGRGWRMRPDDDRAERDGYGRDYQDRPWRRVKVCIEYEDGDEYCHYR